MEHLKEIYINDATVSSNGEFAMRKEGARSVVLTLMNSVKESKNNVK